MINVKHTSADEMIGCGLAVGCIGAEVILLLGGAGIVAILFAAAYKLIC